MPSTMLGVFLSGRKRKFFQQNQTYRHRQQTDGHQRKGAEGWAERVKGSGSYRLPVME